MEATNVQKNVKPHIVLIVSATCYKDLMTQFNASKNIKPKEGAAND